MSKQTLIILCSAAVTIAALAVACAVYYHYENKAKVRMIEDEESTNIRHSFDEQMPQADTNLVGKWQSATNPQWYKVYYDDYDENGYFWGKEWYEDEDVQETDLKWHGNGWFLWRLEGATITELAVTDGDIAVIPHIYSFSSLNPDKMSYIEKRDKVVRNFHKLK
jgi:hypothetical protein